MFISRRSDYNHSYMVICILGRQPAIGLAELESLYGAENVRPVGDIAALVETDVDFSRLGGSVKAGQVFATIPGANAQKAFSWLGKNITDLVGNVEGKLKLGVSLYGLPMPPAKINGNVLSLKKVLRTSGLSVRTVPNTEATLNSAQTYHNKLTGPLGCEILLVRDGNDTIIATATDVQDIDSYTLRDRGRPKRDAFVGMLPPKLAQTIINLATSTNTEGIILDPFCGTGVILQEAILMNLGYQVYGTDVSEKMVRYTRENLNWAQERYRILSGVHYETADATDHIWRQPIDIVACEGYLGQPLGGQDPTSERLNKIISDCDSIMSGFLKNIHGQLKPGTRLCVAGPAWFVRDKVYHLPALDDLENLGYTRIDFEHTTHEDLIYRREDQVVGRELVVITRK